ncbi:hypothetical protein EV714DRAFT_243995 [Schizophyllum commune]
MYWLFDGMKAPERASATCIKLLVLCVVRTSCSCICSSSPRITREFRPWLDAARILLLFTTHISNMCRMFNLYILVINWVDIVLLLIYAAGLTTLVVVRRRAMQREAQQGIQEKFVIDAPDATETGRGDLLHTTYGPPTLPPSSRHAHSRSSASSFFPYPQTATPQSISPPQSRHSSFQSSHRHRSAESARHSSIQSSRPHSTERSRPLSIQSSRPHSTESSRHSSIESSRHNSSQSSRSHSRSRTLTMSPIVEEPRLPEPALSKPDLCPRSSSKPDLSPRPSSNDVSPRSSSKSDLSPRSSARLSRPRHFM